MTEHEMRRNPQRMTPAQLAGLLDTLSDNLKEGADMSGTLSFRADGPGKGFLVQGTVGWEGETIRVGDWQMPRDPFRWYAIGGWSDSSTWCEPPGTRGPDAQVVRTTSGPVRLRFYKTDNDRWCHQPQHHLNATGETCPGVTWPVLISMYGCLEEDI